MPQWDPGLAVAPNIGKLNIDTRPALQRPCMHMLGRARAWPRMLSRRRISIVARLAGCTWPTKPRARGRTNLKLPSWNTRKQSAVC
eukprot:3317018-Pyramimonas_sp.AAC.1